ncbi:MAG: hypothetical protein ABIO70_34555 [Pseudomonadota bacterium]
MTVIEQDAWCYRGACAEREPAGARLAEVLGVAGYGARVSLRGLLVGWLLLGPPPPARRADPATRRGLPAL